MVRRQVQHLSGLSNRAEKRIVGPGSFFLLNPTTVTPRGVSLIAPNHRNRVWYEAETVTRFEYYFTKQPTKFVDGFLIRLRLAGVWPTLVLRFAFSLEKIAEYVPEDSPVFVLLRIEA